ncbi:MAG: succinate dehydrogenase/fumarate reductase iron-sulfur subunit [Acidiferrobacteraceae bacterium]
MSPAPQETASGARDSSGGQGRPAGAFNVSVWRGRENGTYADYRVPAQASQTVLDVITYIQRHLDPGLSYRYACRVGMCGSCAMTVNGIPRWTCRTRAATVSPDNRLRIAPLRNFPVIKDLVCDFGSFFDKWTRAKGYFVPGTRTDGFAVVDPASSARRAADAAIECINCGVCHAACDIVRWNPEYLGPAALNRAWTLQNDVRDAGGSERLAAVSGDAGCHACHSQQSCVQHCPKHLRPTESISGLKRSTIVALLRGQL